MNPICLKIFDVNRSIKVTSHFFDMCLTSGVDGATAVAIFSVIDEKFGSHEIPWGNCVSLSVDSTNSMVDKKNSSASRFRGKNESIFIGGCSCHFAHIAGSNGNDTFSNYVGLNVEDVMVDLYY